MSQHDDRISLLQMLDFANEAIELVDGRSRSDLDIDRGFALAVLHIVQLVGESARRVSEATRTKHPQVNWADIIGMRSIIVHAYDAIDLDLVWDTVRLDIPHLASQLRSILGLAR